MARNLDLAPYEATERLIAHLTLVVGAAAAIGAALLFSVRAGVGVLLGAALAWIGFRWLEGALDAIVRVSTAKSGSADARVPIGGIARLVGRYALIGAVVCASFYLFNIPVVSMLVGLCALGAATILASLYEVLHSSS
jgi:hypothetical protein